jgi:hypothetical protein
VKSEINFEDNLYFLRMKIQELSEGLDLDLSPDFYLDRYIEDLFFIDGSLGRIYTHLKEGVNLIQKSKYYHLVVKIKEAFHSLLQTLIHEETAFTTGLQPHFDQLKERSSVHQKDIHAIRKAIYDLENTSEEQEELITSDELSFLWTQEGEESAE